MNIKPLLQDDYLDALQCAGTQVSIFLINGIKLQGKIDAFDTYVVFLENTNNSAQFKKNQKQMIFKHAISTILPHQES